MPSVSLGAWWSSPSGGTGYCTTDVNGEVYFPTIAAGNMTMVIDNIYNGAQDDVAVCFSLTTSFNLPASKNDLLFNLPPIIVAVRVSIVDEDGNAVPNAMVNASHGPSNEASMTLTPPRSPLNVPYFHSTLLREILNTREGASSGCRSGKRAGSIPTATRACSTSKRT